MTDVVFCCVACGKCFVAHLPALLSKARTGPPRCPSCGAEYVLEEVLEGVHCAHEIPVLRLASGDQPDTVFPYALFCLGENLDSTRKCLEVLDSVAERLKELGAVPREARVRMSFLAPGEQVTEKVGETLSSPKNLA